MLIPNDFFPPFSAAEYERRWSAIQSSMGERGLDCLLVYGAHHWAGTDSGQVNAVYLSNYAAIPHGYVVLPRDGEPTQFLTFANHLPNARDVAATRDVRVGGFDLIPAVTARLQELGVDRGRIGIVGPLPSWWTSTIPVEHHDHLVRHLPGATFESVSAWFEGFRLIKSAEEIERMRRAGVLTDEAHHAVVRATRVGVRHSDLRAVIEDVASRAGGRYPFAHVGSMSMAAPDRFYPDFYPTHRTVEPGDVVMTELALGYGLYFGKLWGSYFVGRPTREYRRLFDLAIEVHDRVIDELRPGMTGREVDAWLEPFRRAGCRNATALIGGWSTYNHAPNVGLVDPPATPLPGGEDFVFAAGQCLTIVAFPVVRDTNRGLWVGSTCLLTEHGLEKLHRYPVNELRVI